MKPTPTPWVIVWLKVFGWLSFIVAGIGLLVVMMSLQERGGPPSEAWLMLTGGLINGIMLLAVATIVEKLHGIEAAAIKGAAREEESTL